MKLWICGLLLSTVSLCASIFVEDSVVKIYSTRQEYNYNLPWAPPKVTKCVGSGCIIEGNRILTNAHVVADTSFIEVQLAGSKRTFEASPTRVGHDCDLAILEVRDSRFFKGKKPLTISTHFAKQQDKIQVYGFPNGGSLSIVKGRVCCTEMSVYIHSYAFLLTSQLSTPIYPGNSGGPVILRDEIVGIVHERLICAEGKNTGRMIPISVIRHFLRELDVPQYQGFPEFSVQAQAVLNPSMRAYFGLSGDGGGLLITHIPQNYFFYDILQIGDVLVEMDGHKIDSFGCVHCEDFSLQLPVDYVVNMKYFGEIIKFSVLRNEKTLHLSARIDPLRRGNFPGQFREYNKAPTYCVVGGLVLQPLTIDILEGSLEINTIFSSIELFYHFLRNKPESERKETVVITQVLADPINVGYQHIQKELVRTVNGRFVHDMRHMLEILLTCQDPYYIIVTESDITIILDRKEALKQTPALLRRHSIPFNCSEGLVEYFRSAVI